MIGTSANISQAILAGEAGQINSSYTDTRFGISQSFNHPAVYKRQKEVLNAEWKNSLLNIAVNETLLKKQVTQLYYALVDIQQKRASLQHTDSLYREFYEKAQLRLEKGAANILEKTSAENLLGQVQIQLMQLFQDASMLQLQFQLLLNIVEVFVPDPADYKLSLVSAADSWNIMEHPVVKLIAQQQEIAESLIHLERSKLLPTLTLGYNNASIKGLGADNKLYSGYDRFSSFQLGIGIPIFRTAQNARIKSSILNSQLAESNYSMEILNMRAAYQSAIFQYQKYLQAVQHFESKLLKNAALISSTANQQMAGGDINYLEWVQLINQATLVKQDYLEAVRNLNEAIIQLNYFFNN